MQKIPFNAFSLQLMQYIIENHPDRVDQLDFVRERGEAAAGTFARCSRQGQTVEEAMHAANALLYRGLHFSPYRFVRDIVTERFDNSSFSQEDTDMFIMQMLFLTRPVIERYTAAEQDPDAFQGSVHYADACNEVTQVIHSYITENGLQ